MSSATVATRPRVVLVTTHWGDLPDEVTMATRLIAGALARRADVEVIHIAGPETDAETVTDSVFTVHRVPHNGARPLRGGIMRAALGEVSGTGHVPSAAASLLERYEGQAPAVPAIIARISPDAIVLAGHQQPFDIGALLEQRGDRRPRLVFFPFCADLSQLRSGSVQKILTVTDKVGTAHRGEALAVLEACPNLAADDIVSLDLALPINRSATKQGLFGVRFFGRYMLLIRAFPPGGPRYTNTATHEVLRSVLGEISVAEVDGDKWRISDKENTLELPVNPSRVNLWRLMAHARATIDVRPPGPIGREAIESMLLGTPVVAPEPSAAMSHVEQANGGLWYRDVGEMFDMARALMDATLRSQLATQAHDYAETHHGQMDDFVERMADLVLAMRADPKGA